MAGVLWADSDYGFLAFVILGVLGAAAAFATGRALASGWSPLRRVVPAAIALAAAVQFLHFALVPGGSAVAPLLHRHFGAAAARGLDRLREDAVASDGDAIFLGLRTGRPDLAGALASCCADDEKSPGNRWKQVTPAENTL